MKRGKKYQAAKKLVTEPSYGFAEAVALLKKTSTTKFDSSCEIHVKLGIDVKQSDQAVRSTVALPHGTGKTLRVIAFVPDNMVKESLAAGAIKAGLEDLIEEVTKGFLDFDVAVAHPSVMKNLGKVAKTLGQKGLMPNPKAGTVTEEIVRTIGEIKKGKVEFRADKLGVVHNMFGKASFTEQQLAENLKTLLKALVEAKPSTIKGNFILGMSLATTMGPGIKLDTSKVLEAVRTN